MGGGGGHMASSPVNSPYKGQWRGTLMFCLTCAWINGWVNNREAGDLRRHRAHYDVTVMSIGSCEAKFSHISIKIQTFSFRTMHMKIPSAKCRPFCSRAIALINFSWVTHAYMYHQGETYDDAFTRKRSLITDPLWRTSNAEIWCLLYCQPEQ